MSRIPNENFAMAGKTGTSQVISKKNPKQDLSKASTPWENRNHALFIGYAPIHNPKYLAKGVQDHGHHAVRYVHDRGELTSRIARAAQPGDVVIALGAGDINRILPGVATELRARMAAEGGQA
jgi:hypothetical protein